MKVNQNTVMLKTESIIIIIIIIIMNKLSEEYTIIEVFVVLHAH